jgi:hypothetical protein
LYGCETWSITLKEEHRLKTFENRVPREIYRPKAEEVTEGWRKPHDEELHNLHSSSNSITMIKSMKIRWVGHIVCMGEKPIQSSLWKT